MRLSVIMPNHNHAALLPRAVEAALSQSRPPHELIVVDDASTDDSVRVLDELRARHPAVRLVRRETNGGVLEAFHTGLEHASGDWFYGAGADDQVLPGFFAAAAEQATRHPDAGIIDGQIIAAYPDHRGDEIQRLPEIDHDRYFDPAAARLLHDRIEAGLSLSAATIYRRAAFDAAGGFPTELRSWADTFICRVLAARHGFVHLARPCVRWSIDRASYSHRNGHDVAAMQAIAHDAIRRLRSPPLADLYPEADTQRWALKWQLEMAGGYADLRQTIVPRRLRDVRRAYAELGRHPDATPVDRLLSATLRGFFAVLDRRRERDRVL